MMNTGWTALKGVRGILSLGVLGIHIPMKHEFSINLKQAISIIIQPVDIFLVLSGLSCGIGYANKFWDTKAIILFYKKRLARILPTYFLAMSISRLFDHQTDVRNHSKL